MEANFFDILRNEIHNIQRVNIEEENNGAMDVNESSSNSNFVKRKADICNADNLNSEDKRNKLNDVTIVSDDEDMEDNIDDANYHEILDYEYDTMKYLIHSLDQMEWVKNEKINNLHFHFDGPKSFLED